MDAKELEEENKSGLNYKIRKYGRVSVILTILTVSILVATGNTPDIGIGTISFSSSDESVAIQGSKHVNPPVHSEYWTSSKFDF